MGEIKIVGDVFKMAVRELVNPKTLFEGRGQLLLFLCGTQIQLIPIDPLFLLKYIFLNC